MIQNDQPQFNPSNNHFEFVAYVCKLIFVQPLGRTVFDQLKEFVLQTSQNYKKIFFSISWSDLQGRARKKQDGPNYF